MKILDGTINTDAIPPILISMLRSVHAVVIVKDSPVSGKWGTCKGEQNISENRTQMQGLLSLFEKHERERR